MKNKNFIKIILLIFIFLPMFLTLSGCNDADDHREDDFEKSQQESRKTQETKETTNVETNVSYYVDEEKIPEGAPVEIFKIGSDLAVENGGKEASVKINNEVYATELWTYHYNYGQGAPGGTVKMVSEDGTTYGPWQVETRNSYYWVATINQTIPAGSYTIIDSDPATWSQNGETKGQGMTWMIGIEK